MAITYATKSFMLKQLILVSSIALLFQIGYARRQLAQGPQPQGSCIGSITSITVCFTDFWNNHGKLSEPCCKALEEINDACSSTLIPQNPLIIPVFKNLCSGASGGGSGGNFPPLLPFPIPLPPIGGGGGGGKAEGGVPLPPLLPLPPIGGGGGIPLPPLPPLPPIGGGGGIPLPPLLPFPPLPPIGGGGGIPLPPLLPLPPLPPIGGGGGVPLPPLFPTPGIGGGASPPTPPKEK